MKLYTTPPFILSLVTRVQHLQAWPLANSAHRLAFGQTESQCPALLATGGYYRPCGPIKSPSFIEFGPHP